MCCGQVAVPPMVSDHEAAQFQVRGMTASWHACMPTLISELAVMQSPAADLLLG